MNKYLFLSLVVNGAMILSIAAFGCKKAEQPAETPKPAAQTQAQMPATSPGHESFVVIDAGSAEKIIQTPEKSIAADVQFGDSLLLVKAFVTQAPDSKDRKLAYLWKSLAQQQTGDYAVGCEIRDSRAKTIWSKKISFLSKGTALKKGDYVYGYTTLPEKVFMSYNAKDNKFLTYFLVEEPGDWSKWPKMLLKTKTGEYNVYMEIKS